MRVILFLFVFGHYGAVYLKRAEAVGATIGVGGGVRAFLLPLPNGQPFMVCYTILS